METTYLTPGKTYDWVVVDTDGQLLAYQEAGYEPVFINAEAAVLRLIHTLSVYAGAKPADTPATNTLTIMGGRTRGYQEPGPNIVIDANVTSPLLSNPHVIAEGITESGERLIITAGAAPSTPPGRIEFFGRTTEEPTPSDEIVNPK